MKLRPLATSCAKEYKGHSFVQTSFTEPPILNALVTVQWHIVGDSRGVQLAKGRTTNGEDARPETCTNCFDDTQGDLFDSSSSLGNQYQPHLVQGENGRGSGKNEVEWTGKMQQGEKEKIVTVRARP